MVTNKNKMEIKRDEETGDLYKNGDKYQRVEVNEQSKSTNGGFSFHARGSDSTSPDILINSRSNNQPQNTQTNTLSDFRYHANEHVQYEIISPSASPTRSEKDERSEKDAKSEKDARSTRSQMSPDYETRSNWNRSRQEGSPLKGKTTKSDEVSLSELKNIKPPKPPPTVTYRSKLHEKENETPRNKNGETKQRGRSSSPEKSLGKKSTTADHQQTTGINRKPSPARTGNKTIIKSRKGTESIKNIVSEESKNEVIASSRQEQAQEVIDEDIKETETKSTNEPVNGDQNGSGPSEVSQSVTKTSPTRLPPAGKTNSLVGNGDIRHHRPPASNRSKVSNGKLDNSIVQQNNRRNSNDKRHLSSITTQKNGVSPTSQSNRHQQREIHGESEKMSVGSRNSNKQRYQDVHRTISPQTDCTEYRIKQPRVNGRENSNLVSPRTSNSQTTHSEPRTRSKDFTFRWNAPSRNTSPEGTEKSNSPTLKQYKPSARIQSFYAFLNGRSKTKKRKAIAVPNNTTNKSEPNGILNHKSHHRDDTGDGRPKTFVYLRSKTSQRSAWDTEPGELTYKPSVNGPGEISQAYIGEDSIREAEMNAKLAQMQQQEKKEKDNQNTLQRRSGRKNPPWYDHGYVLNRRQAGVYKNMTHAYGTEAKKHREQRFVQRLAEYEVNKARQQWEELIEREKKKKESKERQMLQLNELRQRFEDEAYHRFHTQYVTSRVLEHEKMNRNEYGLPEGDEEEPENKAIIKRRRNAPKSLITEDMIHDIYKRRFNKIFDVNKGQGLGRRPKTPKMEGIDTVVIEEEGPKDLVANDSNVKTPPSDNYERNHGNVVSVAKDKNIVPSNDVTHSVAKDKSGGPRGNTKEKKFMVKDVINDAKKQVNDSKQKTKTGTGTEPKEKRSSTPSLKDLDLDDDSDDDDMDDIFEKARRKYDLDVDD